MSLSACVLVPLAEGFEEIEAVTIIDVLRRADLDVTTASLGEGPVTGSHGIAVVPDTRLDDVDPDSYDVIVLPGGMPGTRNLMADERVLSAVRSLHSRGGLTSAICAAPMVLAEAGVVSGVAVTSHPSVRGELGEADVRAEPRVLKSGNVITSQGAGTAMEFALELVRELAGPERADELTAAMVVRVD